MTHPKMPKIKINGENLKHCHEICILGAAKLWWCGRSIKLIKRASPCFPESMNKIVIKRLKQYWSISRSKSWETIFEELDSWLLCLGDITTCGCCLKELSVSWSCCPNCPNPICKSCYQCYICNEEDREAEEIHEQYRWCELY